MKLNLNEKNAFESLWQLIRLSKIKVTATSLKNAILQHNYPTTMLGLSEILNDFNIPNLATKLEPEQLYDIPLPAIAYFDSNGGTFVTVTKIENDTIDWRHDRDGIFKESINEFTHKWQGITLLTEPNDGSGEPGYSENRRDEVLNSLRMPFVIVGLIVCLCMAIFNISKEISFVNHWAYYALLLSKSVGVIISVLLIWYSLDIDNPFLQKVCKLNNKSNCATILNAPASKIFGFVSWAEIGFFYFAGSFLALIFGGIQALPLLKGLGLLALPYTIWSVYYQGVVAKEWCILCISVQVLLWIEFFVNWPITFNLLESISLPLVISTFLITPLLWAIVKRPLKKSLRMDTLYAELQKLKFSTDFVNTVFSKEVFLPPFFEGMRTIKIGDTKADNHFLLILSPTCGSCRQAYFASKRLIEKQENLRIDIVLAASMVLHDEAGKVARRILGQDTQHQMETALHEWFKDDTKNLNKWIKTTQLQDETIKGQEQMALHLRWLEMANIREAPVRFLNNRFIPNTYQVNDLEKIMNTHFSLGFAN